MIKVSYRSSHPEVFCKKGVLKDFTKFTEKHLCQSLFFNKVAGLRPGTLIHVVFCEFCEILKNTFFYRTPVAAASVCNKDSFLISTVEMFSSVLKFKKSFGTFL